MKLVYFFVCVLCTVMSLSCGSSKTGTQTKTSNNTAPKTTPKTLAEKNQEAGLAFLEENKKAEGVTTLPSGMQYKIIQAGTGPSPKLTDKVKVHYRGTLLDGTVFDSSYKGGQPAKFRVNRVIQGWTEALQLMKVGAKWELVIPPDLAYGQRGTPGGPIGPNATLKFEVELLGIE